MYKIKLLTAAGPLEVLYMFMTGSRYETELDVKERMDSFVECMSLFGTFVQLDCQDVSESDFIKLAAKSEKVIIANKDDENGLYKSILKRSGFVEPYNFDQSFVWNKQNPSLISSWVCDHKGSESVYITEELIFIL